MELVLWGIATKTRLRLTEVRLNIIRLMTWSRKYVQVSNLYKKLNL